MGLCCSLSLTHSMYREFLPQTPHINALNSYHIIAPLEYNPSYCCTTYFSTNPQNDSHHQGKFVF